MKLPNYLLVISCSARKQKNEKSMSAWDLYDGVSFRTLKKIEREIGLPSNLHILILSAKYGLLHPNSRIRYYEQKMTKHIACQIQNQVAEQMKKILEIRCFDGILVNLSRNYQDAFSLASTLLNGHGKVRYFEGKIGVRLREMKKWVLSIADVASTYG